MSLTSGTRLGHFEVRAPLGVGGMGEVYRARDLNLDREVALKVLPDAFADDPVRLARFEREARAAAALNHPNILTVFEVGADQHTSFVVSELLSGQTLRLLLGRPLPVTRAVDYARQMAEGLAAAHGKGIVHRDIKPENLFVTTDGRVKILDFGIATRLDSDGDSQDGTLTAPGAVIGTPGYMAPEQVRGEPVDARADIFALGAVLHEMLTGQRAFHGQTTADTMTAILTGEPPSVSDVVPDMPVGIASVVQHCLAKSREQRFQSAKDVIFALELAAAPSAEYSPPQGLGRWPLLAAVILLAVLLGVVSTRFRAAPTVSTEARRTSITFAESARLGPDEYVPFTLSPDGSLLAYVTTQPVRLIVRRLDSYEIVPIAAADDAYDPFFSPDNQWVGYWARGQIKKAPVAGGPSSVVCQATDMLGASWGENGSIVFATGLGQGLSIVPASGGTPQVLTTLDAARSELNHGFPQFIDGGRAVIFTAAARSKDAPFSVEAVDLATRTRHTVVPGAQYGRYLPSGHLIFVRDRKLFAVRFTTGTWTPVGQPTLVVDDVNARPQGHALLSVATNGTLAYVAAGPPDESVPVWVDRHGAVSELGLPARHYDVPRLSPDGKTLATNITDATSSDIWIATMAQPALERFTFGRGLLWSWPGLAFSPDGKRLAYAEDTEGGTRLVTQAVDRSSTALELLVSKQRIAPHRWLAKDESIFVSMQGQDFGGDVSVVSRSSSGSPTPLVQQPGNQWGPTLSADGRYVAYASDETGRAEIYATPYPGPGARQQLTTDGGGEPVWSPDGKEIFYRHDDRMMALSVTPGATRVAITGPTRVLFEGRFISDGAGMPEYDVAPDGRFLMLRPAAERRPRELRLVLNWFSELRQRVP